MVLVGYLLGWAFLTLALTVASRSIHLGPGFANPLPYAAVAMVLHLLGRLLGKWLGERHPPPAKGFFKALASGFQGFLRRAGAFNNFILLSLAYVFGVGTSALFARKPKPGDTGDSFWTDTDIGKKEKDAYYRPY